MDGKPDDVKVVCKDCKTVAIGGKVLKSDAGEFNVDADTAKQLVATHGFRYASTDAARAAAAK